MNSEAITFSNILEHNGMICDVDLKDLTFPSGLILEKERLNNHENLRLEIEDVYSQPCITDDMFDVLIKTEAKRKLVSKTKKRRPLKLGITLKRRNVF